MKETVFDPDNLVQVANQAKSEKCWSAGKSGVLANVLFLSFSNERARASSFASTPASTPFLPARVPLPALLPALFGILPDSDSVPGRQDGSAFGCLEREGVASSGWFCDHEAMK